jgi:hypothetical protein
LIYACPLWLVLQEHRLLAFIAIVIIELNDRKDQRLILLCL